MKFLFDLFPILAFFCTYFVAGKFPDESLRLANEWLGPIVRGGSVLPDLAPIALATAVAIVSSAAMGALIWLRERKLSPMFIIGLLMIVGFGGLTIYLNSDLFIKIKPTALYALFAAALLISRYLLGKNYIRMLLGKELRLPEGVWDRLNLSWAVFFLVMGVLNLYVAFQFSRDTWVQFKGIVLTFAPLLFSVIQVLMVARHHQESES